MERGKDISNAIIETMSGIKMGIIQIFPNILTGIIFLISGLVFAYMLRWSSSFLIKGLLKFLPGSVSNRPFIKNNLEPLVIGTGQLLFLITIFASITVSLKKMGLKIVSEWLQNLGTHIPNILGSLLILFIGWKAKEIVEEFSYKALARTEILYSSAISTVLSWSIFIVSALVSLEQIGIDMSLIVTVGTVLVGVLSAGVALTFALGAKTTISDILCCYQLHNYLKVGQLIELKDLKGTIISIGPIFVLLESEKGRVTIPGHLFHREVTTVLSNEGRINV